ncbi:hypothetical protein CPU12_05760 [Malaciobacter molluscorum LMG 25693]|uniref:Uncharacterized protein n=1 Tax=Malaciobacter molluscorum LMG 25693 TaxID=870501 RepID=A0A2G1DJ13_9BACT|nr:hypothetical protein [Malaciobacter molluscorum]AXX93242.1 hypothetical protein AMOL_2290 [Malaciobacter molluscorum LMG 25693]PHO18498.1 hypothetical protein CPU12_05760 [Malaciobacter molluscorum LMG 25693]
MKFSELELKVRDIFKGFPKISLSENQKVDAIEIFVSSSTLIHIDLNEKLIRIKKNKEHIFVKIINSINPIPSFNYLLINRRIKKVKHLLEKENCEFHDIM